MFLNWYLLVFQDGYQLLLNYLIKHQADHKFTKYIKFVQKTIKKGIKNGYMVQRYINFCKKNKDCTRDI